MNTELALLITVTVQAAMLIRVWYKLRKLEKLAGLR